MSWNKSNHHSPTQFTDDDYRGDYGARYDDRYYNDDRYDRPETQFSDRNDRHHVRYDSYDRPDTRFDNMDNFYDRDDDGYPEEGFKSISGRAATKFNFNLRYTDEDDDDRPETRFDDGRVTAFTDMSADRPETRFDDYRAHDRRFSPEQQYSHRPMADNRNPLLTMINQFGQRPMAKENEQKRLELPPLTKTNGVGFTQPTTEEEMQLKYKEQFSQEFRPITGRQPTQFNFVKYPPTEFDKDESPVQAEAAPSLGKAAFAVTRHNVFKVNKGKLNRFEQLLDPNDNTPFKWDLFERMGSFYSNKSRRMTSFLSDEEPQQVEEKKPDSNRKSREKRRTKKQKSRKHRSRSTSATRRKKRSKERRKKKKKSKDGRDSSQEKDSDRENHRKRRQKKKAKERSKERKKDHEPSKEELIKAKRKRRKKKEGETKQTKRYKPVVRVYCLLCFFEIF